MKKIIFLLFVLNCLTVQLYALQNIPEIPWADGESKGEDLEIFLLTFSPGEGLTDWFGHTALAVRDSSQKIARVYNFGFFSFEDGFVRNFAMGRLIFWAGDMSWRGTVARYINADRTIVVSQLNLSAEKKLILAKKLALAVLPENSKYLYHHYNENCATRLRDLIDEAVDGQFREFSDSAGRLTFRQHTLRYTEKNPLMQWLLMFLMNDSIDKPIKKWDEMFLPDELFKYTNEFSYVDSTGSSQKLLGPAEIYYDSKRAAVEYEPDNWPLWTIWSGLLFGIIAIGLAKWSSNDKVFSRIIFALYNSLFSLITGIIGSALFFMGFFTDHLVTHYNENLIIANPFLLLIFFSSMVLIFKDSQKNWQRVKILWFVFAALTTVLIALKILPWFDQDNLMVLSVLFPLYLGFSAAHHLKALWSAK